MNLNQNFDYPYNNEIFQNLREGNPQYIRSYLSAPENQNLSPVFLNQALVCCFQNFNPHKHSQIINDLLQKGANLNAQDSGGRTPLMFACLKGNMDLMNSLLSSKVDINIRDHNKANALFHAINNDTPNELFEICQILINNGSEINNETNEGVTPLWKAIERGQVRVVQLLCDRDVAVNVANKNSGDTPLHLAVRMKNRTIMKILMEKFAKTDKKNKKNQTPLDLTKDDAELYEYIRTLDVKQKSSEHKEITLSLNNNRTGSEQNAKKGNPNKQQIKLKNYNLSPQIGFKEPFKSDKSDTNSDLFELEISQQDPNFLGRKFQQMPQIGSNYSLGHQQPPPQDHILNHLGPNLGPNPCFSPPLQNQMTMLHNSYSDNSFNQQQQHPNSRFIQKNPKGKKFQPNKDSGFQPNKPTPNPGFNYNNKNYSNSNYNNNYQNPERSFNSSNNMNYSQAYPNNLNEMINIRQMTYPSNFSPNEKGSNTFTFNNPTTKSDDLKALDSQNEELRAEVQALERELNGLELNEEEIGESKDPNVKGVNTEFAVSEPNRSLFVENISSQEKVVLYLPTEKVAGELHQEILEFEGLVSRFQNESLTKFQNFMPTLRNYIQEITNVDPEITVYGSYETGLALPYSDIDVAVSLKNGPIDEMIIQSICENLKRKEAIAEVKKYYGNSLHPTHPTPSLNQIKIDATFPKEKFDRRLNLTFIDPSKFAGWKYVKLMKQYMKEIKPLRPLVLIIKEFIFQSKFSLANMTKGGMNSYSLILMIIAFLQNFQTKQKIRSEELDPKKAIESPLLGNLLIEFFYYYGFNLDYVFEEIKVMLPENFTDEKAQQQNQNNSLLEAGEPPIPKLVLGDPLKRHINVGRSAQIVKIKGAFSLAYLVLHQNYKSNACFLQGEAANKVECCRILERLFTCTHHTGFFRKINQI